VPFEDQSALVRVGIRNWIFAAVTVAAYLTIVIYIFVVGVCRRVKTHRRLGARWFLCARRKASVRDIPLLKVQRLCRKTASACATDLVQIRFDRWCEDLVVSLVIERSA
jgi:hypothetical protein